ncbi:lipocalin family protein [Labilibaculum sp.]|uniref:lipocalin family protein n=1 Tax=Labilibaculum sp. TaxID=2060723 RepID=UPI00356A0CD7
MTKIVNVFMLLLIASIINKGFTGCETQNLKIDNSSVRELDINKYLGNWFEIARYDNRFERGLVGVKANYLLRDDGKISVINTAYKDSLNGEYSQAIGKAKIPDPENEPGKLKVSFFLFFYGDYYVMELDKDYQWAVVGSSSDKYLWILSRKAHMEEELYQNLLSRLQKRNYDISKLIRIEQYE